jgi:hypothetical protein
MLQGGTEEYATTAPWIAVFPGQAIMLTVFGINLFGDSLRDMLDPKPSTANIDLGTGTWHRAAHYIGNKEPIMISAIKLSVPLALAAVVVTAAAAASAQPRSTTAAVTNSRVANITACDSEQKQQQVLQSRGVYLPDGCRKITVMRLDTPAGALCMMDLAPGQQGVLGEIRSAATTTQWWLPCSDLHAP